MKKMCTSLDFALVHCLEQADYADLSGSAIPMVAFPSLFYQHFVVTVWFGR